ncbi:MAG: terminase large subunit [Actinomycetota bacterium]|nr:terminase large subunit [Actinomycetota bacterium]
MKAGPKASPAGAPLNLDNLPESGGERAIAFVEEFCHLPKGGFGAKAGEPIRLRSWQRQIVHGIYSGDSRPRQGVVSVARKNGKSLLAACLALYHLLADGVESAEVIVVSVDERTAKVIFRMCQRMVELDERLAGVLQAYADKLVDPATDSVLEALPGEWSRLQGRNPSFTVCDELHVMSIDTWDALALAGGTRSEPMTLGISTECDDDEENLMARLVEHGRDGDDPDFFFAEWTAPPNCELDDEAAWSAANPMLGDTLDPDHLRAMVRTTRESRFRRFHLNQRVRLDGAWLTQAQWAACADPAVSIPDGATVCLGFDGSFSGDTTALTAVSCTDVPHVELVELWEAPEGHPTYRTPIADVEDAIRAACRRWRVREVAADPFRWARSLQALEAEGVPIVEYPQSPQRMSPATARFYQAVTNGGLTHSGDPRLARHIRNCVLKEDARGSRLSKPPKDSRRRIDAAVSALMAFDRAAQQTPDYDLVASVV